MSTTTVDLTKFKSAVGFTATFSKWGNSRKGNKDAVKTSDDARQDTATKERLRITKELIKCKEYEEITKFLGSIQRWIYEQTVPSFFKQGFQLCGLDAVDKVEKRMRKAANEELPALVSKLIEAYPGKVEEAKAALAGQFNPLDYPAANELPRYFSIGWNWISFSIPEQLPAELRAVEQDKLKKQLEDAGQQITLALRTGFQELLAHAVERLTPEAGADKPKTFRDSMLGNISQFLETFNQRNLMNDVELAKLVGEAKTVLLGLTPQKLRDYQNTREGTRAKFAAIQAALDPMIVNAKTRLIDLSEE